jgi:hypothetical protein
MKYIFLFLSLLIITNGVSAQNIKGLLGKAKEIVSRDNGQIGTEEIISGLKEALNVGAEKGTSLLSKENGFFNNQLLKIILPPEAQQVEKTLRNIGLGKQVDEAILSMNRGAEEACKQAAPIFVNAIRGIDVKDAVGILKGSDTAATAYLRGNTTASLTQSFRPVIEESLKKVDATKYWNSMITAYNKISFKKINPDLAAYVTEKALSGVFVQIAIEEKEIRKNPAARTTDLLKRVFNNSGK